MFSRRLTDGTCQPVPLENQYAGPTTTPCWVIGAGPSLSVVAAERISQSPAARFTMNLAGSGLLRPHFWTSYDPTSRFHRSIYLDAGITKFVHAGRAMDLIPETTHKVCDAPALYLIDRTTARGFDGFPGTGTSPVTDWQDSLIQAIDIAYRLGFRQLFLAGCEMWIVPSRALRDIAQTYDVRYQHREPLGDFIRRCEVVGLERDRIESLSTGPQYHFDEQKTLAAAIQTDAHYFRVAQTLRLCRRSMAIAGLQLTSVTPMSRLNDYFPYLPLKRACQRIDALIGDPATERTRGRYSQPTDRRPGGLAPMRDLAPHFWQNEKALNSKPQVPKPKPTLSQPGQRLKAAIEELPAIPIDLREEG